MTEEIDGDFSLWEEKIPSVARESLVDTSQDGDEVGFECPNCSFGFVASVHVGRYFLEFAFPDFGDVVEEVGTDFVVHELHVDRKAATFEAIHEDIVCWDTMSVGL